MQRRTRGKSTIVTVSENMQGRLLPTFSAILKQSIGDWDAARFDADGNEVQLNNAGEPYDPDERTTRYELT